MSTADQTKLDSWGIRGLQLGQTCHRYGGNSFASTLAYVTRFTTIAKAMGIDKIHLAIKTSFTDLRNDGGKIKISLI